MRVIVVAAVVIGVFYSYFPGQVSQIGRVVLDFLGFVGSTLVQGFTTLLSQ